MKLTVAIIATIAAAADASRIGRRLSFEKVAGYKPDSQVTDHCAIDLDQAAMEIQLAQKTNEGFEAARDIYNKGGNSKSYAQITLDSPLTKDVKKGDTVSGTSASDTEVAGKFGDNYSSGTSNVKVYYQTTDVQKSYVQCQVGALQERNLEGCFKGQGVLAIDGDQYAYNYLPESDNRNGRTIAGFSSGAAEKMLDGSGCPGCPYKDFKNYHDYYGQSDYADEWVQAAFEGRSTNFASGRGNQDFSKYGLDGREQVIKKGTAYMNVFMYVIREFEDALDDCKRGLLQDNYNSVHAWDEGVCFYTGSVEGQDGLSTDGKLLHQLADKRCIDYKTCGVDGVDQAGQSKLNYDLFDLFALGNWQINSGNCPAARDTAERIITLMYVPMIQGSMRYAYKVDKMQGAEKEKAEGAVFMAAVVPRVYAANKSAANTIFEPDCSLVHHYDYYY